MKHLGDITKIKGSDVEIVDIITGGSPCQDLSVAGKRKGLAGERSGLFMEQIRIIKEMRDESRRNMGADVDIRLLKPRFMVWENVQGAFSSNNGEDFRCVLEETAKVVQRDAIIPRPANGKWSHSGCIMGDGWSIAWRLHDAQFWGVPQRRKRISLVADFAGGGAPEILFERKGLPRDIESCGTKGKGTSENVEGCVNPTSFTLKIRGGVDTDSNGRKAEKGALIQTELSGTLGVSQDQTLVCFEPGVASRVGGHIYEDDKSATIRANAGDNALAVAYGISSYDSNAMKSSNPHSGIYEASTSRTLDLNGGNPGCNQGGIAVVQGVEPTLCIDQGAGKSQCGITENVSPTLATTHGGEPVVYDASRRHDYEPFGDICETVQAHYGTGGGNIPMVVGKPQPISCEVFHCETEEDKVKTLKARDYKDPQIVAYGVDAYNQTQSEEKTKALNSSATDSDHIPLVYGLDRASFNQGINAKYEFQVDEEKTQTLVAKGPNAICARDSKGIGNQYVDEGKCIVEPYQDLVGSLCARDSKGIGNQYVDEGKCIVEPYQDSVGSLCARDSKGIDSVVRRLTPMECERLQGFPTIRKVRFTEMTKDEYIAWNINEGNIVVDTEYGKVFATRGPGGVKLDEPKELTGSIVNGYRVVSIRNGETKMQCRVHRIVWIAEHGIIPDGYVIDHINNDKQDNRLCNLQLLTNTENSTKARIDGLYKIHGDAGQTKITDEVHDFIQYVYGNSDLSIRQLSEIFGISKSRVHQIIHDDGWTDIGDWIDSKGKKHKGDSDSPRYKALGNSIALPFWQWMAERMVDMLHTDGTEEPTMASLFDGIGGFPLVYSRVGCKPIWASEIEEFPIAVTKIRFPSN